MDAYGDHMEFCQVQLNYIDYEFQEANKKIAYLKEKNIPVLVMEPLRGGKLANVSKEMLDPILKNRPNDNVCSLAFRFIQSFDNVLLTLSGMSNLEQVVDNIITFESEQPLSDAELDTILEIAREMTKNVPCTSCRYCTEYCPRGLDIPKLISLYNELKFTGGGFLAPMYVNSLSEDKRPHACVGCRACEAVCPQCIKISEVMTDFSKKLKGEK